MVLGKIDSIFCTISFEAMFPLAHDRSLTIVVGSNLSPIIWDSGVDQIPKWGSFKFEKWLSTRQILWDWYLSVVCRGRM